MGQGIHPGVVVYVGRVDTVRVRYQYFRVHDGRAAHVSANILLLWERFIPGLLDGLFGRQLAIVLHVSGWYDRKVFLTYA